MSGLGAALRELGKGDTEPGGRQGLWGGKLSGVSQERPEGPVAGAERGRGGRVGCWVGEEARVL